MQQIWREGRQFCDDINLLREGGGSVDWWNNGFFIFAHLKKKDIQTSVGCVQCNVPSIYYALVLLLIERQWQANNIFMIYAKKHSFCGRL